MQDRIAELRGRQLDQPQAPHASKMEVSDFSKNSSLLQVHLHKLEENNKEITRLKQKQNAATLLEQEKTISKELDELIEDNMRLCKSAKEEIEFLGAEVQKIKQHEPRAAETRIKDIQFRALKGKFGEMLKESQKVQNDYKSAVKGKIARQAKIIDPTLTDEQIEEVCQNPEGAGKLMEKKMLGIGHMRVKNTVSDIQEKHRDILKLERSVREINQMFLDAEMILQAQSEVLENVEINIDDAKDQVRNANVQLHKAKRYHQMSKKCKWITFIILLVIVVLIAIIVPTATK